MTNITDLKINMENISGNAFTYTQTLKNKNGCIVKYTLKCFKLFVLHMLNTCTVFTRYHVFDIVWHSCQMLIRCNKIW